MINRIVLALVLALTTLSLSACGGGDDAVVDGCERLDECNALAAGISVNECVETVDVDLQGFTPSQRKDWEGLMNGCLDFSSCDLFIQCIDANGL